MTRTYRGVVTLLVVLVAGCSSSQNGPCEQAEGRLGYRLCVEHVDSMATWSQIAGTLTAVDQVRSARYLVPAEPGARLPTVFEDDAAPSRDHYEFLSQGFPELFPGLALDDLDVLTTDPQRREFFAGIMTEYVTPTGDHVYGYLVWDRQDAAGTITCDQAKQVQAALHDSFTPGPLVIVPATSYQRAMLAGCDVPSYDASQNLEYEAYNVGVGYGSVHRYTLAEFQAADAAGNFGWQDILVLDEAPIDISTVVSGVITGTRQGELSHLNVRSATRGTPNCYSRDILNRMAQWDGQLVRIECTPTELRVEAASPADAQAWWDSIRPAPIALVVPDRTFQGFPEIHEVPTATPEDRALLMQRFGGKGSGLAKLYQRLGPEIQMPAFLIPFGPYFDFMQANGLDQLLAQDLADPQFQSDSVYRRQKLSELQLAIQAGTCDPALVSSVSTRILEVFGTANMLVRFRSSSNAEDALEFGGSGLYESISACLADDLDGDTVGPSQCDPTKSTEHGICRALTYEWSQLWSPKAFDERAWYSMDQSLAGMAIAVNPRTDGELANIVAFSGNPLGPDRNAFLIDAQLGAYDVVSSIPGVFPEKDLLSITSGQVTAIDRPRASSQVGPGEVVLTDDQLRVLGAAYANIANVYPIDDTPPAGKRILLNSEWKLRADGSFVIYEVRPYLDNL